MDLNTINTLHLIFDPTPKGSIPTVEVYKNLRDNCWSVRNPKTGKVILHTNQIYLKDTKLIVRPAGRRKVLMTHQKNVHAFVKGTVDFETIHNQMSFWDLGIPKREINYSPYLDDSFVTKCLDCGNAKEIYEATRICLNYNTQSGLTVWAEGV